VLERGLDLPRIDTILRLTAGTNVSACALLAGMEWQPGRHVDGDFRVEVQRRKSGRCRSSGDSSARTSGGGLVAIPQP